MKKQKIILYGRTGKELALEIHKSFSRIPTVPVDLKIFPDGELKPVIFPEILTGKRVIYIHSTYPPAENLIEFFLTLNALENSLKKTKTEIIVISPYFGYTRQDRIDIPGVSFSLKWIADSISKVVNRLIFIDLHNPSSLPLFPSAKNILPIHLFSSYLKTNFSYLLRNARVVSPDSGAARKNRNLASSLSLSLSILDKRRDIYSGEITFHGIKGKLKKGENIIIWDDILASGGTFLKGIEILKEKEVGKIVLIITHLVSFLIKENKIPQILKEVELIITTDSIPCPSDLRKNSKIHILSLSPLIQQIIKNLV